MGPKRNPRTGEEEGGSSEDGSVEVVQSVQTVDPMVAMLQLMQQQMAQQQQQMAQQMALQQQQMAQQMAMMQQAMREDRQAAEERHREDRQAAEERQQLAEERQQQAEERHQALLQQHVGGVWFFPAEATRNFHATCLCGEKPYRGWFFHAEAILFHCRGKWREIVTAEEAYYIKLSMQRRSENEVFPLQMLVACLTNPYGTSLERL